MKTNNTKVKKKDKKKKDFLTKILERTLYEETKKYADRIANDLCAIFARRF